MHRVHAQGTCTGYMHRVHAQGTCTGYMHRVHAQGTCIGYMHRVHAQGTCTGCHMNGKFSKNKRTFKTVTGINNLEFSPCFKGTCSHRFGEDNSVENPCPCRSLI